MTVIKSWLKIQSIAISTAITSVTNFLIMRGVIDWSVSDLASFNLAYASVVIVLRQLFSVTTPVAPDAEG